MLFLNPWKIETIACALKLNRPEGLPGILRNPV